MKQFTSRFREYQLCFARKYGDFTEYKEQMVLEIRSKLFVCGFQPAKKEFSNVPITTFADLVRLPTAALRRRYPGRYFKFFNSFRIYKKRLRSQSWSALTMIYPRVLYLWYYYLLFWWAEYCGVLPKLLEKPDGSLIPELFVRYVAKIDSIIDNKGGKEYLFKDLSFIKRNCSDLLNELLHHIWGTKGRIYELGGKPEKGPLHGLLAAIWHVFRRKTSKKTPKSSKMAAPPQDLHAPGTKMAFQKKDKRELCDKIWQFRQNSLIVSRNVQCRPDLGYDEMINYKNRTAGDLFRTWADLLCDIYHVGSRANSSKEILGLVCLAIQVVDDMLDSPTDYRDEVVNIFNQLLKETTDEFDLAKAHFEQFPYNHLDWAWANKYLPITCKKAADLITSYIDGISAISEDQRMTSELCEIIKEWRDISLVGKLGTPPRSDMHLKNS